MISGKKIVIVVLSLAVLAIAIPLLSHAATLQLNNKVTGLFLGIWHGLVAPYSLVLRWFIPDMTMYYCQNASWLYDFGFLIGIFFSLPLGWIAVIAGLLLHLFP